MVLKLPPKHVLRPPETSQSTAPTPRTELSSSLPCPPTSPQATASSSTPQQAMALTKYTESPFAGPIQPLKLAPNASKLELKTSQRIARTKWKPSFGQVRAPFRVSLGIRIVPFSRNWSFLLS
ncbi:unnamed protein product [Cuscuta europaea]|uniref:Uncharacterized protein n=1 Tax=Cuscuta europaea TaxID=41803 RepID=A0A9P0ZKV8_CUSEU|nr:unnamed protein product [Cuscuta europaea]